MSAFAILTTTVGDIETARRLADRLVGERLAACVQIQTIESIYRWEGRVERAPEYLLICKIAATDFEAVSAALAASHPYEVPQIVLVPIASVGAAYGAWLAQSLAG